MTIRLGTTTRTEPVGGSGSGFPVPKSLTTAVYVPSNTDPTESVIRYRTGVALPRNPAAGTKEMMPVVASTAYVPSPLIETVVTGTPSASSSVIPPPDGTGSVVSWLSDPVPELSGLAGGTMTGRAI